MKTIAKNPRTYRKRTKIEKIKISDFDRIMAEKLFINMDIIYGKLSDKQIKAIVSSGLLLTIKDIQEYLENKGDKKMPNPKNANKKPDVDLSNLIKKGGEYINKI